MDNFAITAADAVSRRYKSNDPEAIIAQRAIKIKDIRFCEELLGFYTVLLNCEYIGINPNCSRRITIAANRVVKDEGFFQVDLFTDTTKLEKEKKLQNAMLGLKKKFGKNAVLKGTNYLDGATMRERNQQIGGHKAK